MIIVSVVKTPCHYYQGLTTPKCCVTQGNDYRMQGWAMVYRPVKVRFEKGQWFIVIPHEAMKASGLVRGDYVLVKPFNGGFIIKKIEEEDYAENTEYPA